MLTQKFLRFVALAAACLGCVSAASAQVAAPPWITRFSAKQITGNGVGHEDGITQIEWFVPLDPSSETTMWFADFSGFTFAGHGYGANAGAGYRWYDGELNRIFGFNAYWDMRDESGQLFNQAGIGLEALGPVVDFRVNGYTPAVNDASQHLPFVFTGHNLIFRELNALSGVDYECTINLPDWGSVQSSIGGGGYYFDSSNTGDANGWRVRAEVAFRDTVAASFVVQDDDLFGRTFNMFFEFRTLIYHDSAPARAPMGPLFRNERGTGNGRDLIHRLGDPVKRQQNIVLHRREEIARDTSGTPLTFLHVVEGGAGDGTFEMPFGAIGDAMADPLAPTSVVYTPTGGTFTESVTLVSGTRLLSNGPVQTVMSSEGGLVLPFSGTGTDLAALPASIVGDVTLADSTEFSGFAVEGGVSGVGIMSADINFTSIDAAPGDALSLTGSDDITVEGVAITSPTGRGILLDDTSATLTTVSVDGAMGDGLQIDTGATDREVSISRLTVTGAAAEGIDVNAAGAGDLTLTMDTGSVESAGNALSISKTAAGDASVSVDRFTFASTGATGILADGSAGGGTLFVRSLNGNTVTAASTGGLSLTSVTFDADPMTAGNQQVGSSTLTVGESTMRIMGDGVALTDITGDWNMGIASLFNSGGTGLVADNSGIATPFLLSSTSGSVVDSLAGAAIELNTVTSELVFETITSTTSPTRGIGLTTVTGTLTSGTTTLSGSVLPSIRYEAIALPDLFSASLGSTTINSTISDVEADNIEKAGVTDGLTEIYSPLIINGP